MGHLSDLDYSIIEEADDAVDELQSLYGLCEEQDAIVRKIEDFLEDLMDKLKNRNKEEEKIKQYARIEIVGRVQFIDNLYFEVLPEHMGDWNDNFRIAFNVIGSGIRIKYKSLVKVSGDILCTKHYLTNKSGDTGGVVIENAAVEVLEK